MFVRFWPALIFTVFFTGATGGAWGSQGEAAEKRPSADLEGAIATAKPLPPLPMPSHPFQSNQGYAGAHGDSYNSGTIPAAGPLKSDMRVRAFRSKQKPAYCSTQHFDANGRIISVCVGRKTSSRLVLLDPDSMNILAQYELPPMAGFYFRMDNQGRVVVPTGDMSIQTFEIVEKPGGPDGLLTSGMYAGILAARDAE